MDNPEVLKKMDELFELHELYVIKSMEPEVDPAVSAQKTRWYKFRCWLTYGHLDPKKKGVCLRCGKILTTKTETKS